MKNFIETINYYGLRDLGFISPKFTWLYQRIDGLQIKKWLDREMATLWWINIFPEAKLFHLTSSVLDYSSLAFRMVQKLRKKKARKTFRLESMWPRDRRCEEVVQEAWEEGKLASIGNMLGSCLEKCQTILEVWNKMEFEHVGTKIAELQKRLAWIEL